MKEPFDIVKVPLEKYFVDFLVPKLRTIKLSDSHKIDGLSLREYLGITLLSFFLTEFTQERFVPAINKNYDDATVAYVMGKTFFPVEQVFVYDGKWDNRTIDGVKNVLNKKTKKGQNYAEGSWLLIYSDANGEFDVNDVRGEMEKSHFSSVIAVGQSGKAEFSYYFYIAKYDGLITNHIYEMTIDPLTGKAKLDRLNPGTKT